MKKVVNIKMSSDNNNNNNNNNNALYLSVPPHFFKCPISMDVMKSPVSLCTGVTYDRASIQKWLDSGHNTCPATMQVLDSTDVVPNLTLRRLIRVWSDSALLNNDSHHSFSKQQVLENLKQLSKCSSQEGRVLLLTRIAEFVNSSVENRQFVASFDGFVTTVTSVLLEEDMEACESAMNVLDLVISEKVVREKFVFRENSDFLSRIVVLLQRGSLETKIKAVRVLERIAFNNAESQRLIADENKMLNYINCLISSETDERAIDAGLSALVTICTARNAKKDLVRLGIVKTAGKLISDEKCGASVVEKALKLVEIVSTSTEGRTAICDDDKVVPETVKRLMKVSNAATEHGIGVIWSMCYMSRDRTAQEKAMAANGLTKVLLVMQSNVCGGVKQMCGDLVKVFRVNSKSCLASYETRTSHIMPY